MKLFTRDGRLKCVSCRVVEKKNGTGEKFVRVNLLSSDNLIFVKGYKFFACPRCAVVLMVGEKQI